ncbi:MAG: hypothetical protein VW516_13985, partial [Rhodospirillaceae bacterium]
AGRDRIAVILFPTAEAAAGDRDALRTRLSQALAAHNVRMSGGSTAVACAAISDGPPDRNAGEINDKGHLVQKTCLDNRAGIVEQLYQDPPAPHLICPNTP